MNVNRSLGVATFEREAFIDERFYKFPADAGPIAETVSTLTGMMSSHMETEGL